MRVQTNMGRSGLTTTESAGSVALSYTILYLYHFSGTQVKPKTWRILTPYYAIAITAITLFSWYVPLTGLNSEPTTVLTPPWFLAKILRLFSSKTAVNMKYLYKDRGWSVVNTMKIK